jgi:hypothetical protein
MRSLRLVLAAASLTSVAVGFACSSDPVQPTDAGIADSGLDVAKKDSGNDAGPADTGTGIDLAIVLQDRYAKNATVDGAEVCVLEHAEIPCQTSDASGQLTLTNLPSAELTIGIKKAGYTSVAFPIDTGLPIVGTVGFPMLKTADVAARLGDASVYDAGAANVATGDLVKLVAGPYTLSIQPASGTAETVGDLRAILNVTPGAFELTSTPLPDSGVASCTNTAPLKWSVDGGQDHTRAKAYAGYVTAIPAGCK